MNSALTKIATAQAAAGGRYPRFGRYLLEIPRSKMFLGCMTTVSSPCGRAAAAARHVCSNINMARMARNPAAEGLAPGG